MDECYNCEWSTELTVPQAYDEYVKAWFACKLLAKELELGDPDGFVFNMSVGYDLKGIQSPKVDAYIEGMKDASGTEVWPECMDWALANLDRFEKVDEAYVRGKYSLCRTLMRHLEDTGDGDPLKNYLPQESATKNGRFSPYHRYEEIYNALH